MFFTTTRCFERGRGEREGEGEEGSEGGREGEREWNLRMHTILLWFLEFTAWISNSEGLQIFMTYDPGCLISCSCCFPQHIAFLLSYISSSLNLYCKTYSNRSVTMFCRKELQMCFQAKVASAFLINLYLKHSNRLDLFQVHWVYAHTLHFVTFSYFFSLVILIDFDILKTQSLFGVKM